VTLLLFDIDGTLLLRAAREHADAIRAAIERVWHVRDLDRFRVETAGRTDPAIARALLLQAGVSAERIDAKMPDFKHVATLEYARRAPADLSATVAPGVRDLLGTLAARDGFVLSLVTGNLEAIAHLKLARAGLGEFFDRRHGGYGSDHEDRAELPPIARRRAGSGGTSHPAEDTVVIGDTPRDIACARADGVRCIAVATGQYRAEELTGADAVARSAREVAALLDVSPR
jgi:phosphoglycolate phosphatase